MYNCHFVQDLIIFWNLFRPSILHLRSSLRSLFYHFSVLRPIAGPLLFLSKPGEEHTVCKCIVDVYYELYVAAIYYFREVFLFSTLQSGPKKTWLGSGGLFLKIGKIFENDFKIFIICDILRVCGEYGDNRYLHKRCSNHFCPM